MNASPGMGAELKRIRATSQSLNHEGAARSRIFRVKHLEYTLFGGSLLRGDDAIRSFSYLLKFRNVGTAALGCPGDCWKVKADSSRL
jgi:hypothetical protein